MKFSKINNTPVILWILIEQKWSALRSMIFLHRIYFYSENPLSIRPPKTQVGHVSSNSKGQFPIDWITFEKNGVNGSPFPSAKISGEDDHESLKL